MSAERARSEELQRALLRRLHNRRALARAALLFERIWPAAWPALGVLGAAVAAALLGLPEVLPPILHAALLAVTAVLAAVLLVRGLLGVRRPGDAEADRRLERASGLSHRPLAVLADRPALAGAEGLWAAHVARSIAAVGRLRVGLPHPGLAARDPRALRGLLVVGLIASLGVAGADAPARLGRALHPAWVPAPAPPATQLQAWVTPPAYTAIPPLFLKPATGAVSVPAGSHLTVSVTGGSGEPSLSLAGVAHAFQQLDAISYQADADLNSGGRLAVRRDGREIAGWNLTVVADAAPVVSWPEPPGRERGGGRTPSTRLPWQVSHAYGVTGLSAELRLAGRPDAPPLSVTIPLPGGSPKSAKGARIVDLTAHPWAGLPVTGRLVARDAPGQVGTSAEAHFTLPERRFDNPVAQALIAVRKQLTLRPDERLTPAQELDRLAGLPDVWDNDLGAYLNLRAIGALLRDGREPGTVDDAEARLWTLALHIEEGAADLTARALEQARQALQDALDAQKRGDKIDQAEIDRRMKELQDALQKHLQALADQARRDPDSQQFDPNAHPLDTRDMQRLADEMREAAREGRMDDARQKLAELEKLLDEMKHMQAGNGRMTPSERARAAQRQRGQQQMNALGDIVQRLGTLLDHTDARTEATGQPRRHWFQP